jgi:nicotinamidase/pyrazinamidase
VRGTPGAELHPGLVAPQAQLIVRKGCDKFADSYSAFADERSRSTGLGAYLGARGINEVDVVGLALDYCVAATAIDAVDKCHMWVRVIRRGCAAIDRGNSLEAAMHRMKEAGVVIL